MWVPLINDTMNSTARKQVLIIALLFGVMLLVPSTVAAAGTEIISEGGGGFGAGSAENFTVEEAETSNQVQWEVETEANDENLVDSDYGDSLHIYIDTDGETGLDARTVQSERWGDFFDGLDPISADYRVRVVNRSGDNEPTAIVEEHNGDIRYTKIESTDVTDGDNLNHKINLNKEAIGSPETFEYKFAYVGAPSEYDITSSEFRWGPAVPQEFVDGQKPAERITIQATANFDENIDTDSVEFRLENNPSEGEEQVVESAEINPDVTNRVTADISLTTDDFGSGSELFVDAAGTERYPFNRNDEMNNSIEVGDLSSGNQGDEFTIDISRIKAEVVFGDKKASDEVASGFFRLDASGSADSPDAGPEREFNYDGNSPLVRNFTVNPNDFDGGEVFVNVETIGDDENYPFDNSNTVSFSSPAEISFNAGELDYRYDFNLPNEGNFSGYEPNNPDVVRDGEFRMMVNLSRENANKSIQQATHTVEFDPDVLNVKSVSVDPADPSTTFTGNTGVDIVDEENGEVDINVFSNRTDLSGEPVANKTEPFTHNITFGIVDGLEDGREQEPNAITTDMEITNVELYDNNNQTLSAIRDERSVALENSETRVTEDEITHLTEGGDMVGSPMKYEVDVTTNGGQLGNISLIDPEGNKIANGDFGGKSGGVIELETNDDVFKPNDNTFRSGQYQKTGKFEILIEDNLDEAENNDDANLIYSSDEDSEQEDSVFTTTIYKKYDVTASGQDSVTTEDVVAVAERVPEEGVEQLPFDTADQIEPRADLDNTGEVTSSNLATIVREWNQADFVSEVNATIDEDPNPNVGIGSKNDTNVTVFDQRRGDTQFDADSTGKGGNVTVDEIDDGDDDVTVKGLSEGETKLVEDGEETFKNVQFINADDGDTIEITFNVANDIADPDPEGTEETITVELNGAVGETVSAEFDNNNVPETEFNLTNYELKNYGDGGGDAENVTNILVEVEDTEQGPVNFTGDAIGYDGPGEENGGLATNDGRLLVNLTNDTNRFPADEQFNDLIGNVDITVPENTTDETLNVTVTLLDAGTDVDERSDFDADSDEVGATSVTEKVLKVNLLANGSLDADLNETKTGGGDLKTALNISHTVENASALNVNTINITREDGGTGALNFSGDTNSSSDIDTLKISNSGSDTSIKNYSVNNVTNSSGDVVALEIDIPEQNIYNGSEVILNTSDDIIEVGADNNDEADIGIELKNGSGIIEDTKDTDTVEYNTGSVNYSVTSLSVNASSVDANESVQFKYAVDNTGSVVGNQTIEFLVNGTQNQTNADVELNATENVTGSFNYTTNSSDPPAINASVATDDDINSTTVDVNATTGTVSVEDSINESDSTFNVTTSNIDWNTASGGYLNISDEQGNFTNKSNVGNNVTEIDVSNAGLNLTVDENVTARLYESSSEQNLLDTGATNVSQ